MAETSKIKIKMGTIEVDYDGPPEFLDKKLAILLQTLAAIRTVAGPGSEDDDRDENERQPNSGLEGRAKAAARSTSTIARDLAVSSGRELMIAAALKLSLAQPTFTRKMLLAEMQSATSYWKSAYSNSLSNNLIRAARAGDLNHVSGTTYSMPEGKKKELLARLK